MAAHQAHLTRKYFKISCEEEQDSPIGKILPCEFPHGYSKGILAQSFQQLSFCSRRHLYFDIHNTLPRFSFYSPTGSPELSPFCPSEERSSPLIPFITSRKEEREEEVLFPSSEVVCGKSSSILLLTLPVSKRSFASWALRAASVNNRNASP